MTKETRQLKREIKKMIWQLRWMMVKHWISNRLDDIIMIMRFTGLIISAILGICIVMISICIVYALDIIVSLLTLKKHRNASNWLGNRYSKLSLWMRYKFKDKESE